MRTTSHMLVIQSHLNSTELCTGQEHKGLTPYSIACFQGKSYRQERMQKIESNTNIK